MKNKQQLDLSNAPPTLFFYGIAGGGKTYVANLLAKLAGWYVYDADADISDAMKLALAQHKPFTDEMRDEYFERISKKIIQLQEIHPQLVISQAVYKQQHRGYLQGQISNMEMVCVEASDQHVADRISGRSKGISVESAAALRADFEAPAIGSKILTNESGSEAVITQLNHFYSSLDVS